MKLKKITLLWCILCLLSCQYEEFSSSSGSTDVNEENVITLNKVPINAVTLNGPSGNWVQVWGDEFNGNTLDLSKWTVNVSTRSRAPRRNPNQDIRDWRWNEENVSLNGEGQLVLSARKTGNHRLRCGAVNSRGKFDELHGYFEVRMKVAETQKGCHTAFWLFSPGQGQVDGTANDGAEIDVFESAWTGDYTKSVVHIDGYGVNHRANTKQYDTPGIHDGYHTYGLDWISDTRMDIYYDGERKVRYNGDWVPDVREYILLSVGASFGDGNFQAQSQGYLTESLVDYVRVYKRAVANNSNFRLVNKETNKWLRTTGNNDDVSIAQAPPSATRDWTQWSVQETDNGYFYFVNKGTGKYFRPETNRFNSELIQKGTSFGGSWSQWRMVDAGDGYVYLVNRQTHRRIRPQNTSNDAPIVLSNRNDSSDWAKWRLEPVE